MIVVESIPNVSEGRRAHVIEACADAIRATNARLLDMSADPAHNRSVFSLAGTPEAVEHAVLALFDRAIAEIDLRQHRGEHPRIGAVDVVPFVPIAHVTMADCVGLARRVAEEVASRHGLPVFLYGEAASRPNRRRLEDIRRGGFEGLAAKLRDPAWQPDFGPLVPHPSAGASVIGARPPLIAYNINLMTRDSSAAQAISAAVRESTGGLPAVKAMAVSLPDRGLVQVSMNLTNYRVTSMFDVFAAVEREAGRRGVEIASSEIVGLVPSAALEGGAERLKLEHSADGRVLEARLKAAGLGA